MRFANAAPAVKRSCADPPVRAARVNGVELHYIDTGAGTHSGAALILLHGGMGDLASWAHQIRALAPRHRIVAYSRRHSHPNRNGAVDRARFADRVSDDVNDLLALQDELRLGPAHLIGTSYGALLALAAALRSPARVASLVLAEPPLHRWACATESGKRVYSEFIDGVWRPATAAFGMNQPRRAMQLLTDGMWGRATFESWSGERIDGVMCNAAAMHALTAARDPFPEVDRSAVAGLAVPTLLLQGVHTSALHRLVMDELATVMSGARRVEIAFAGHGVPNENPSGFNAAITSFLEPLEPLRAGTP
jgi:pimeloyl-ACP methyl ester carboxylesterase